MLAGLYSLLEAPEGHFLAFSGFEALFSISPSSKPAALHLQISLSDLASILTSPSLTLTFCLLLPHLRTFVIPLGPPR